MYFCYVNPDEDCDDVEDGWSFKSCQRGKTEKPLTFMMSLYQDAQTAMLLFRMITLREITVFLPITVMKRLGMIGLHQKEP